MSVALPHRPVESAEVVPDLPPRPLSTEECWHRLRRQTQGRLGYQSGRGPRHVVVPYTVAGEQLILRLPEYNEAARCAAGQRVTFDVIQLVSERVAERVELRARAQASERPERGVLDALPDEHWPADLPGRLIGLPVEDIRGELEAVPGPGPGPAIASRERVL